MSYPNSKDGRLTIGGGWPKYEIRKFRGVIEESDGSGEHACYTLADGEYWVFKLDPEKEPACVPVMRAYVHAIVDINPALARDLESRYPWINPLSYLDQMSESAEGGGSKETP